MTNYYTNKPVTAEEFFNEVCKNYINYGEKTNDKIVHIVIWNLSVKMLEILAVAKANGYNAKIRKTRTLVIVL